MKTIVVDGHKIANEFIAPLQKPFNIFRQRGIIPKAVALQVGNHPATNSYITQKKLFFQETGALLEIKKFPSSISQSELEKAIFNLNHDQSIHGIILELPLPSHLYYDSLVEKIAINKDLDGLNPYNYGRIMLSSRNESLAPSTAKGVIMLLNYYQIPLPGQNVTIISHSNIVGKPLAAMLICWNCTVTVCHIFTKDLSWHTKNADIIISATGNPCLITSDMVKKGVIAIDIGYVKTPQGFQGDFDFESIKKTAKLITPVPGGTGPITTAALLHNLLTSTQKCVALLD